MYGLRQQTLAPKQVQTLALGDFVDGDDDYIGLYACSAACHYDEACKVLRKGGKRSSVRLDLLDDRFQFTRLYVT